MCKAIGCNEAPTLGEDFCEVCKGGFQRVLDTLPLKPSRLVGSTQVESLAQKYPKYYKSVEGMTVVDAYAVHHLFNIQDPSGALQHASKKLLLSGAHTGGKSAYDDIREARDTLTRWLQLNEKHQGEKP